MKPMKSKPLPGSKWKVKTHVQQSIWNWKDIVVGERSGYPNSVFFYDLNKTISYEVTIEAFYKLFEPVKNANQIWKDLNKPLDPPF